MESVSVFCLLLLVCSLSGAELQDNEITEQRKPSVVSLNVSEQPQSCPSDVHAVLRDMSAALAEHRVRIEQLQTQNQEQAAKLREQTNTVDTLKQQLQEQSAKLRELEKQTSDVEPMNQQLQAQATELKNIKAWKNVTENQVEALRRDRAVGQVAFSASLLASGSGDLGPFNTHTPLVFRYVVSNIGNAYSPDTGFFTAPVRGAYHFEFHIGAHGHSSYASGAVLVKNGQHIFMAYEHQTNGYGNSANGATLLLEAGDVVFLRLWQNTIIYDDGNHHSTFSGFLLFPM